MGLENIKDGARQTQNPMPGPELAGIRKDIDFKPYLDAVTSASQRTRGTIYIIIVTCIALYAFSRNTDYPSWMAQRLMNMQLAEYCVDQSATDAGCPNAITYANGLIFNNPTLKITADAVSPAVIPNHRASPMPAAAPTRLDKDEILREYHKEIDELLRAQMDMLRFQVPIFGIVVDNNDVGLFSSLGLFALILIFLAVLIRERKNLEVALAFNNNHEHFDPKQQLINKQQLLMTQVLSNPAQNHFLGSCLLFLLFQFPAWILVQQLLSDRSGNEIAERLGRIDPFLRAIHVQGVSIAFVFVFATLCFIQWRAINRQLIAVEKEKRSVSQ